MSCIYSINRLFDIGHVHYCHECKHYHESLQPDSICYSCHESESALHQCNWEARDEAES